MLGPRQQLLLQQFGRIGEPDPGQLDIVPDGSALGRQFGDFQLTLEDLGIHDVQGGAQFALAGHIFFAVGWQYSGFWRYFCTSLANTGSLPDASASSRVFCAIWL